MAVKKVKGILYSRPISRLHLYKELLYAYNKSLSNKQRNLLARNLTFSQREFLIDTILNAQHLNLKLSATQLKKLARYKNQFKQIANPKVSRSKKNKLLAQNQFGGFASVILGLASALLPPIIEKLLNK